MKLKRDTANPGQFGFGVVSWGACDMDMVDRNAGFGREICFVFGRWVLVLLLVRK